MARTTGKKKKKKISSPKRRWLRYALLGAAGSAAIFYTSCTAALFALKWMKPPTTAVHVERRIQSWFSSSRYQKRYHFVPATQISADFQHAVIAAEDARFFKHHGFDWREIGAAVEQDRAGRRLRGASTIDQQLVKNLFLTTSRSPIRKALEASLVPLAEAILGKQRILELYLNVVEWGPGVYGAEAAARYHYGIHASRVNREQAACLAALLPAPLERRPSAVAVYANRIKVRMRQAGW